MYSIHRPKGTFIPKEPDYYHKNIDPDYIPTPNALNVSCPECGAPLIEGKDVRGHCFNCPYCGIEGCNFR